MAARAASYRCVKAAMSAANRVSSAVNRARSSSRDRPRKSDPSCSGMWGETSGVQRASYAKRKSEMGYLEQVRERKSAVTGCCSGDVQLQVLLLLLPLRSCLECSRGA